MKTNKEYCSSACAALKGRWKPALLASVILIAVAVISNLPDYLSDFNADGSVSDAWKNFFFTVSFSLPTLFFFYPISVGYVNSFKEFISTGDENVSANMLRLAKEGYKKTILTFILRDIMICLWTLLFIIPGILMAFSYAMVPYIVKDYSELSPGEVLKLSNKMMDGHRFDLFLLYLRFTGWFILSLLTAGIGLFWLCPYMTMAQTEFYRDLKAEYEAKKKTINN